MGAGGRLSPKTPATVVTGLSPVAIAVSPDGRSAYVTNSGDNTVSQFTIAAGGTLQPKAPARIAAGKYPYGVAGSPDGKQLFVANADGNSVSQFGVGAGGLLKAKAPATVTTGVAPFGLAVSLDRPQPSPPPPPPPRNLTLPSVVDAGPHTYRCSPGSWDGAEGVFDPARGVVRFTYTWQRLTRDSAYTGGYRVENVASGRHLSPVGRHAGRADPAELAHALRGSDVQWRRVGHRVQPEPDPEPRVPAAGHQPPFGNLRIRGIDVFQTVQPNSGSQMYSYAPGLPSTPSHDYPGAGTPTSFVKLPNGFGLPGRRGRAGRRLRGRDPRQPQARGGGRLHRRQRPRRGVGPYPAPRRHPGAAGRRQADVAYPDGNLIPPARTTTADPPHGESPLVNDTVRKHASRWGVQFDDRAVLARASRQLGSRLDLRAHVELAKDLSTGVYAVTECDRADCSRDNTFRLDGVPLATPQGLTVRPVYLEGILPLHKDPEDVLAKARAYPGGEQVVDRGGGVPAIDIRYESLLRPERGRFLARGPPGRQGPRRVSAGCALITAEASRPPEPPTAP